MLAEFIRFALFKDDMMTEVFERTGYLNFCTTSETLRRPVLLRRMQLLTLQSSHLFLKWRSL